MDYKLVKHNNEYWLLDYHMARNIGEYFLERLITGAWDIFHVDSPNDLVHDGLKIIGSTLTLPGVAKLDREKITSLISLTHTYTTEDIRASMLFIAKTMRYIENGQIGTLLEVIDTYSTAIQNEWMCEIDEKEAGSVISGGFIPSGVIGGKGLTIHQCYTPNIVDGAIKIKIIK